VSDILKAIDRSRGWSVVRRHRRRVVARIDVATVERIDALLPAFDGSSRASLIRAFCVVGLDLAEEHVKASKPEGGTP
jgi:hypothetical protein